MKCFILFLSLSVSTVIAQRHGPEIDRAILCLTGASSMEDLDEEILDELYSLASRPLNINTATEKRLTQSGLFSPYQVASLMDYRRLNGDVLSAMELMLVDGFDENFSGSVSYFVSFSPSISDTSNHLSWDSMSRFSLKYQHSNGLWSYSEKMRLEREGVWSLGVTTKNVYEAGKWPPEVQSASVALYGRSGKWILYGGDFNARFGQGLALWSGFSLSGAQSAASFAKHPAGLSPAWTLSPSSAHRGMAVEYRLGRIVFSGFYSHGRVSGANAALYAKYGQIGMTVLSSGMISADWRWSFNKADLFGELSGDRAGRTGAGLLGITYNIDYQICASSVIRYYPTDYNGTLSGAIRSSSKVSDETGASMGIDIKKLTVYADASFHPSKAASQYKFLSKYSPALSDCLDLQIKLSTRYRPDDSYAWRNEFRSDLNMHLPADFLLSMSLSACNCKQSSWLAFAECGYSHGTAHGAVNAFLRFTAFGVDNWEDRIYVYERDVPGTFSVPAYYGRGCSISAVASLKSGKHCKLNARLLRLGYPWMAERKEGKTEFRLQLIWNL